MHNISSFCSGRSLTLIAFVGQADEAEHALNEQYDRQIASFYEDEREKAQAMRQVFEENWIAKLFEETD